MSSEHLYGDYRSDISGSDFDHGGDMSVKHYRSDEDHPDVVKTSTTAGNPDLYKVKIGDPIIPQMEPDLKKWLEEEKKRKVPYKFREDELLAEITKYINDTYGEHYSQSKFQASEFIFDNGHGVGMNVGCIMKYAQRYGKKGGYNRKDILKIIHYAILLLYVHDEYIAKESK